MIITSFKFCREQLVQVALKVELARKEKRFVEMFFN